MSLSGILWQIRYKYAEKLEIEDEQAFSKQELGMIYKLIQKGIEDRSGDEKNEVEAE